MFRNLSPGAIGISAGLEESLALAKDAGFEGLEFNLGQATAIAEKGGVAAVRDLYAAHGLRVGGWGLPVAWNGTEEQYQASLQQLPHQAKLAAEVGSRWCATYIPSWTDEMTFDEYFDFLVRRFRPAAEVLRDYGHRLGLEFLGPQTLRAGHKHEFIHTAEGMLELCGAIGTGNMGLLLDAWHWYTSHGTIEDLHKLGAEDVVYVHINDAPAGIVIDEQIDNERALPGETGVIDLTGFLRALHAIGFDGPVTPEPFSKTVNAMPVAQAARVTGEALLKVWEEAFGK